MSLIEKEIHDSPDFYTVEELKYFGFRHVGKNCQISRKCSWYAIHKDSYIGDNVRIDDFCIFKGHLEIESYIHICAYCMVSGAQDKVTLDDFVVLAARCSVYTGSNDHTGDYLGAPQASSTYTNQTQGPVSIGLGTLIGAHCVILPNTTIGIGAAIGAGCTVSGEIPDGGLVRAPKSVLLERKRNVQRIVDLVVRQYEENTNVRAVVKQP